MKYSMSITIILTIFISYGLAQPGTKDTRFGVNGIFYDSQYTLSRSSLLLKDGKILLGGTGSDGVSSGFFLMRLTNDGNVDSVFGKNGRTAVDVANYNRPQSLAIQPDGKFIAAGYSYINFVRDDDFNIVYNMNFNLVRFLSDGNVDSSFGENGIVQTDFGAVEEAYTVAVQTDGKILVGGSTGALPPGQNSPKFLLVRYLNNGQVDSLFGIDGRVTTIFNNSTDDIIKKILLLSDGGIIVCGTINGATGIFDSGDFALAKYLPNGDLDESFGIGGKVTTRMNSTGSLLKDAVLLKDGKILTVGVTNYGNEAKKRTVLVQYNSDGSLDESFGRGGKQEVTFSEGSSEGTAVQVQENGKIVFSAFIYKNLLTWFGVVRCNVNGSLDSSFGTDAKIIEDIGFEEFPRGILIQNDGKIIITGYVFEDVYHIFVARYYGDPTHPLFTKIRRWIRRHILNFIDVNGTASYYVVEQQNSGGNFMPVARIAASKSNTYSYDLNNITTANTNANFRIKAVYADGVVAYSDAIQLSALQADTKVSISPNPASSIIQIALKENALQDGTIYIYDAMGTLVKTQSFAKQTKISINISSLQRGHYWVVVNSNGIITEGNFLKE